MKIPIPIIFSVTIFVAVGTMMFFFSQKKPFLLQTFFLGACYFLLAHFLYKVIWREIGFSPADDSVRWSILIVGCLVSGFLEELARLSAVMTESIKKVNSIRDGVWYCFSASLGLALFENIFYAVKYEALPLQFARLVIPSAGHLAYGIILGYFIGKMKLEQNSTFLWVGIGITTVIHAAYNILLYQSHFSKIFVMVPVGIEFIVAFKILTALRKEFASAR